MFPLHMQLQRFFDSKHPYNRLNPITIRQQLDILDGWMEHIQMKELF